MTDVRIEGAPPSPIERIMRPFERFTHRESSGGIVLMVAAIVALAWANSPYGESYERVWEASVRLGAGARELEMTLHHVINDGLMAVFFFLVGLEIKREMLVGELASLRAATLPIAAAFGGMVVPAALYAAVNAGGEGMPGWGIPMATDIAFALGVLALVGGGIPVGLKVFLTALAIVDDLGAVLVIALFYTSELDLAALGTGALILLGLALLSRLGVRRPGPYAVLGLVLWLAFLHSGVHATVAGVLLAMTVPARTRIDTDSFLINGRRILDRFDAAGVEGRDVLTNQGQQEAIQRLEANCEAAQAPLQRIERGLHRWVAFGVIPLFALANAGVHLTGDVGPAFRNPVTVGVILGLVIGKPVGISLFAWLAVRSRAATLPQAVTWRSIVGVSFLGGIGFTMSLFIGALGFGEGSPLLDSAKIGILSASLLAGILGWLLLRHAGTAAAAAK